ncbi:MAG: archaellin/type IV pilin N-terminal domain-containing protein [Thermofilum sp.]
MRLASRRGISPVIATVILVAVTIAVAIAVAFWMTGIVGLFAGAVEKLEITSIYAEPKSNGDKWTVTIRVNNTGTIPVTIDQIFINGIPVDSDECKGASITDSVKTFSISPGGGKVIKLELTKGESCGPTTFNPGISIEVKLHTAGGREYPKLITLP